MRTFEKIVFGCFLVIAPLSGPAFAFDGAPANQDSTIAVMSGQPGVASGLRKAAPSGPSAVTPADSLTALQYAAEEGHFVAQWRLGRMYALGDGVAQDDVRAF